MYEMSSAYPEMNKYYGFLVGPFYTLPYAISGLFAGNLTRTINRKDMLFGIIMLLGCFQLGSGMIDSLLMLGIFRFMHGAVSAGINPFCYSLVSDIFPPERRTTANSLLSVAQFIGISLSSMSILFIKKFGWRWTYILMGLQAIVMGTCLLFFKNPKRGQYDVVTKDEEKKILEEPKKEQES